MFMVTILDTNDQKATRNSSYLLHDDVSFVKSHYTTKYDDVRDITKLSRYAT